MEKQIGTLDWSLIRAFLAVAEEGSLSGAARVLGQSQPTLGRQIREMESALGVDLFHRHAKGLSLSDIGEAMRGPAETMREAAGAIALVAAGEDSAPEGDVRLTASKIVSHFVLPPILARLRAQEPGIKIDLVASDSTDNLLFREADIALRMYRPEQLDMVTRHVCDLPLGIYAAHSYLDRVGRPKRLEDLMDMEWVGYDRSTLMIDGMRDMGWEVGRDFFATRTDDQAGNWQLIRAGCGIGIAQVASARGDAGVERLFPDAPLPSLPVWLTTHERLRHTPRVARVWEALAEGLKAAVS